MKTILQYDFYIQITFHLIGIAAIVLGELLLFYFIVGIPQLISFIIRLFQRSGKSVFYYIYGLFIIPSWISLFVIRVINPGDFDIRDLFIGILIASLIYSPILASLYVYMIYEADLHKEDITGKIV